MDNIIKKENNKNNNITNNKTNNYNKNDDEIIEYLKKEMKTFKVNNSIIFLSKNILSGKSKVENYDAFKIINIDEKLDDKKLIIHVDNCNESIYNSSVENKNTNLEKIENVLNKYLKSLLELVLKEKSKNINNNIDNRTIISNINHNFRTSLNGLALGIQILDESLTSEYYTNITNNLFESCIELTKYVNDIIDYYMLSNNKVKFTIIPCNIHIVVDEIIENYSASINDKNIEVSKIININNTLQTDTPRLKQVLNNLISNAINHTKNKIWIHIWNNDNIYYFDIKDNGEGIPKSEIKNIFNPFYQLDNKDTVIGLGLGLTLSKFIINNLGGEIRIISCNNNFNILFTVMSNYIEKEIIKTNKEIFETKIDINKELAKNIDNNINNNDENINYNDILIIEDNVINSNLLKLMIEKICKGNIVVINDPSKVMTHLKNNKDKYKFIFLDIRMPKISGYDLLSFMSSDIPEIINRIYIITALITEETKNKLDKFDILGVISKPIQMNSLRNILI